MAKESLEQLRQVRVDKLKKLREIGQDPYPARVERTSPIGPLVGEFDKREGEKHTLVGRVMAFRSHGKIAFADLRDDSGNIQLFFRQQGMDDSTLSFDHLLELVDIGDFLQASGELMKTRTGEVSIMVTDVRIITKTLRPLPEKWSGLKDKELRQRKRYLDMVMDPEVKERFKRRAVFWQEVREFLIQHGFYEVNTPVLELTTGGADAKPFVTHMDAIDQDFYLRISHELPLKRLIGGGFEKVFDLGPRFRNEGMSDEHLPEHIAMEFYWAYADYREGMKFTQDLFRHVMKKVYGTLQFTIKGFEVDLEKEWERIDFAEIIKERFAVDVYTTPEEELLKKINEHKIVFTGDKNRSRLVDTLWKDIRKTLAGPAFIINEPKFLSPLAKSSPDNPEVTERFHALIAGSELVNAFSELNDPIDQYDRFKEQQDMRDAGDDEAMMLDEDFIEMLEYGMPPTFGFGMSERVFWFFEDVSAREGVPFPPHRAKDEHQ